MANKVNMGNVADMKISVIVPVYNAGKYLHRCIGSVMAQTYTNWELIMVDDGSKDDSATIIDSMAKQDNRIVAIHQANVGAGEARNTGIDVATGDYAVFLDSDDYIDKDYFSLLLTKAKANDVVFIDVKQVNENGKGISDEYITRYKNKSKDFFIRSQMTGKIPWGGCRKATKLELIRKNNIRYTNHMIGEEALYSFQILRAAERIGFLEEKPVYFYVKHDDSLSRSMDIDPWGGVVEVLTAHIKEQGLYSEYADTLNAFRVTALIVSLDRITQYFNGAKRADEIGKRMAQFKGNYDANISVDTENMSYKARIFYPFVMRGIVFPLKWASIVRRFIRDFSKE